MIRSHSASGDLHGVQPDPVAADILRKEPEQETFVRMKISPVGMPPCLFNISFFVILNVHNLRAILSNTCEKYLHNFILTYLGTDKSVYG